MKKILFVGSEAVPFASSGGLGDVLGSLPAALMRAGDVDVRVVIPMYSKVIENYKDKMTKEAEFTVCLSWRRQYCGVWSYKHNGVIYYFIDNEYYFKRPSLYGSFDDGERYAFFCKAVMEMLPFVDFIPDILHANDWQSALCVIYQKRKYRYIDEYAEMKAVYTIHNIGYQGIYNFDILSDVFCLDSWDRYIVEYDGCINLTKGAIVCADKVTTVSPTYANEIRNEYFASGLHHIINMYSYKLCGIINGIDTDYYNPEADTEITKPFSLKSISGKADNKLALQKELSIAEDEGVPMVAMVSRLAHHKGFDLVRYIAHEMLLLDMQLVILGTGEGELEEFFLNLSRQYPKKCAVRIMFDKSLAKRIYASADMFLMPSMTEPCGLAQMIASRYGTVPIVRETGGLYDTIKPYNPESGEGNGITFHSYNAHDMFGAVKRALELYQTPQEWSKLIGNAMRADFSWDASAGQYLKMYDEL